MYSIESSIGLNSARTPFHPDQRRYADIFVRHEIDLPTFATLTDEELKEIGISTFGARKKLLALARETKKKLGVA